MKKKLSSLTAEEPPWGLDRLNDWILFCIVLQTDSLHLARQNFWRMKSKNEKPCSQRLSMTLSKWSRRLRWLNFSRHACTLWLDGQTQMTCRKKKRRGRNTRSYERSWVLIYAFGRCFNEILALWRERWGLVALHLGRGNLQRCHKLWQPQYFWGG